MNTPPTPHPIPHSQPAQALDRWITPGVFILAHTAAAALLPPLLTGLPATGFDTRAIAVLWLIGGVFVAGFGSDEIRKLGTTPRRRDLVRAYVTVTTVLGAAYAAYGMYLTVDIIHAVIGDGR